MPKQDKKMLTTVENSILQSLYLLTLIANSIEEKNTLETSIIMISSTDLKRSVGGQWSSFRHDVMKRLEQNKWLVCQKVWKKTPQGIWYYGLTESGVISLEEMNVTKDYFVVPKKGVKTMAINGTVQHFLGDR